MGKVRILSGVDEGFGLLIIEYKHLQLGESFYFILN